MAGTINQGMAPAPTPLMPPVHDGLAIASLVSAFFIPPLGIIFGHISHHVSKQAHRARSGIATAGLVLGYLFTAIGIIVAIVVAQRPATRHPSARRPRRQLRQTPRRPQRPRRQRPRHRHSPL